MQNEMYRLERIKRTFDFMQFRRKVVKETDEEKDERIKHELSKIPFAQRVLLTQGRNILKGILGISAVENFIGDQSRALANLLTQVIVHYEPNNDYEFPFIGLALSPKGNVHLIAYCAEQVQDEDGNSMILCKGAIPIGLLINAPLGGEENTGISNKKLTINLAEFLSNAPMLIQQITQND